MRTILKLAEKGIAVRLSRGRFAQWESIGNIIEHYRKRAAGRESRDGTVDAVKANAGLREAQRRLTELKVAQLESSLISLPEIKAAWDLIALNIKQMFLSLPGRARFLLPHLDARDQEVLEELVRGLLTEVAFCTDAPHLPGDRTEAFPVRKKRGARLNGAMSNADTGVTASRTQRDTMRLASSSWTESRQRCRRRSLRRWPPHPAQGTEVEVGLTGIWELPKATGALTQGAKVFWDNAAKAVTGTASGNTLIGVAAKAAASGDATVRVRHNGAF